MLGKCTNPSCSAAFLYLQEGTLFRVECDPALDFFVRTKPQYFWLCRRCSERMTLRLDQETTVKAVPFAEAAPYNRCDVPFAPVERKEGLLLSLFRCLSPPAASTPKFVTRSTAYAA